MGPSKRATLSALISCALAVPALAQLEPPSTGGLVALEHELRMLGHYKRVLMIGAHPDDEDTELLTVLVRGEGAEAAYLSLNRGEGGQNLIGAELGEALGLLRSEELLAARRLDGAQQFFTRAYDFGYSKTLEDTWRHWPRDSVLKDVVRVVRQFRPQIVVSIFTGTPRDGHGQHQAAGWAAAEAFRIAGDSTRFPDTGSPWSPLKLYRSTRFDSTATTLTLDGGELDEAVGQSFHQMAMRGRSLHRSQDMGQLQRMGPSEVRLQLVEDRTGRGSGGLWDGVDTTFQNAPLFGGVRLGDELRARRFTALVDSANGAGTRVGAYRFLQRAVAELNSSALFDSFDNGYWNFDGMDFRDHLNSALTISRGIVVDAVASDAQVVPGQRVLISVAVWNTSASPDSIAVQLFRDGDPSEWYHGPECSRLKAGEVRIDSFDISIPVDFPTTTPYFLRMPRTGDLYTSGGRPFELPLLLAEVTDCTPFYMQGGFATSREVTYRTNNQAYGEIRRPVFVVPRVDVKVNADTMVWPTGSASPHQFTVTLTHGARDTTTGQVWLEVPEGWPAVSPQPFRLTGEDEHETYTFSVRPPATFRAGAYEIRAVARDAANRTYTVGAFLVDYSHIHPRQYVREAVVQVNVAPLAVPRLARVGYIRGAADRVPEALRSVGINLELLDRPALERGDLSRYDAIVIGSRAYETDSALVENNGRIQEYARNGGLVVVQYQQQFFFRGNFAPFPLTVGGQPLRLEADGTSRPAGPPVSHDRITDETAPVRILDPNSTVVSAPNRIGPDDWAGWVQERGLYFAHTWDPAYRPVLEMADPGEVPLDGGLLIASVGRGRYVYTGLAFFRELPAGVPGAFRLFANLLALGQASVP